MNAAKNLDIKLWKKKEHTKQLNGYWKTILKRMSELCGLGKTTTLPAYMNAIAAKIEFIQAANF